MKKRLIALMIAGGMLVSGVGALTGCVDEDGDQWVEKHQELNSQIPYGLYHSSKGSTWYDSYICFQQKDEITLHKGDIYYIIHDSRSDPKADPWTGMTKMEFDCGKEIISNYNYSVSYEQPSEEDYDKICEDCFGNGQ